MTELRQNSFQEISGESISNPQEPHLACVLLLDTSISMGGEPIRLLNKAYADFIEQTSADELAKKRVDLAVVEFNTHARVIQEFTPLSQLRPIELTANGSTSMGEGCNLALDLQYERKLLYADMGTPCFPSWIVMITDGSPTDDISLARERIKAEESKGTFGKLKFWAIGSPGYDADTLKSLTKRCIALDEANFDGFFNWLSESMSIISVSRVDENPQLSNLPKDAHVIPRGW